MYAHVHTRTHYHLIVYFFVAFQFVNYIYIIYYIYTYSNVYQKNTYDISMSIWHFSGTAAKVWNLGGGLRAEPGLPAHATQKDLVAAMEHEAWDENSSPEGSKGLARSLGKLVFKSWLRRVYGPYGGFIYS